MYRYKKIAFFNILDIWFDEDLYITEQTVFKCLHTNEKIDSELYQFKMTQKTFLLNIANDEETILAGMDYKSCRYPINKAKRDGIRVWKAQEQDKVRYLDFQNTFCLEKGIPQVDKRELDDIEVYVAEAKDGEFLGGCAFLLSADRKTVRYKYGATAHKLNANEAILWEAIRTYHAEGVMWFDFGGCIPTEDKTSYYYRHYHFKKKFGGELIDSYVYFGVKGIFKATYRIFSIFVKVFFKGDVNNFTIWLNKKKLLR